MDDLDGVLHVVTPWLDRYLEHGLGELSPREAVGVGVWLLDAELNNGGFHQYYSNTRGTLAVQTVDALMQIGATETASLLAAANQKLQHLPLPADRTEGFAMLDQVSERARFQALEAEYYQQREDRMVLLAEYLRSTDPDGRTRSPKP
jgi:hypothetical protein